MPSTKALLIESSTSVSTTSTTPTTTVIQSCTNIALNKQVSQSGANYIGNGPELVVNGLKDVLDNYWAGVGIQSITIDLGSDYNLNKIFARPYGNSNPIYYYASSWKVEYSTSTNPTVFQNFVAVNKLAGAGTLGTGITISNGCPGGICSSSVSNDNYKSYEFSFQQVTARRVRLTVIAGDPTDSNVDEIEVCGFSVSPTTSTSSTSTIRTTTSTTTSLKGKGRNK